MRDIHWHDHHDEGEDTVDLGAPPGKRTLAHALYRRANGDAPVTAGPALASLPGAAGAALAPDHRSRFEAGVGADLSDVRLHTGAPSAAAADELGARAFTSGRDIHFGAGQYQPDDPFGMHLLAHEVAHTVQQGPQSAGVQTKLAVSEPGDAAERAADAFADAMVEGGPVPAVGSTPSGVIHRAPDPAANPAANPPATTGAPGATNAVATTGAVATTMGKSVGQGGENVAADVTLVQDKLKALGYTVGAAGVCDDVTIKAIRYFQAAIASTSNPSINGIDGLIDKGGNTDKKLFGASPPAFAMTKGAVKAVGDKATAAIAAAAGTAKAHWDSVVTAWNAVSPYLPDGCTIYSGFRTTDEQTSILKNFFNTKYKDDIVTKYGQAEWDKYQGKSDDDALHHMHTMVNGIGQKIAFPGTSEHEQGNACDITGSDKAGQVHGLLYARIDLGDSQVSRILVEKNGCIHFEWK